MTPWTEAEMVALRAGVEAGLLGYEIAEQLGRTLGSVHAQAHRHGMKLRGRVPKVLRPVSPGGRQAWTAAEIEAVRLASANGESAASVALQLGRTTLAVHGLAFRHGWKFPRPPKTARPVRRLPPAVQKSALDRFAELLADEVSPEAAGAAVYGNPSAGRWALQQIRQRVGQGFAR